MFCSLRTRTMMQLTTWNGMFYFVRTCGTQSEERRTQSQYSRNTLGSNESSTVDWVSCLVSSIVRYLNKLIAFAWMHKKNQKKKSNIVIIIAMQWLASTPDRMIQNGQATFFKQILCVCGSTQTRILWKLLGSSYRIGVHRRSDFASKFRL